MAKAYSFIEIFLAIINYTNFYGHIRAFMKKFDYPSKQQINK